RYRLEVTKSNSKRPDALGAAQRDTGWDFDDNPPEDETATPGKRGPKPRATDEAKDFLRRALVAGERKQCEVVDEWVKSGKSNRDVFTAARDLEAAGELHPGETPSPKGR